ncbi:MAG: LysR family transcriptional regulator [Bacillota bacterium]
MEKIGFNCKVWLEMKGQKVFGDGPCDILQRVERTGSLRQAAVEINMSYSQAWRLVRSLEKGLGCPLLIKKTGGERGGGSLLTAEARELIGRYLSFRHTAEEALQGIFNEHFGSPSP